MSPASSTMIAVSPIACPKPSIVPVITDGRAVGRMIRRIVVALLLPTA